LFVLEGVGGFTVRPVIANRGIDPLVNKNRPYFTPSSFVLRGPACRPITGTQLETLETPIGKLEFESGCPSQARVAKLLRLYGPPEAALNKSGRLGNNKKQ
jgi:hypothetical protein